MDVKHEAHELRQIIRFYWDIATFYFTGSGRAKSLGTETEAMTSIPKILHYCWFGKGSMSNLLRRCMETWDNVLPDFQVVRWDENNFPMDAYPFARQAYRDKKWAMVSDVARLHALYYCGGIYLDTDVEVLRPFDGQLLSHSFFGGYERPWSLSTAVLGARPKNEFISLLLAWYLGRSYGKDYYEIANTRIVTRITRLFYGLKKDGKKFYFGRGNCFYPQVYFSPENGQVTEQTYTVHHFSGLWKP